MEVLLNNIGFSFTLSKFIPYVLMILLGLLLVKIIFKKIASLKLLFRILILSVLLLLPFCIYFAVHPIYEGDLSNEGREIKEVLNLPKDRDLLIIVLADCPYCLESVKTTKILIDKKKIMKVEYVIVNGEKQDSIKFSKMLKGMATCSLIKNSLPIQQTIQGSFPSFILVVNNKPKKVWNNNTFSVRAWDEIIATL